jgi:hypothetical protein
MFADQEPVRCEDCTRVVSMGHSTLSEGSLLCKACAEARAQVPSIFTPRWSRLWQVFGGRSTFNQKN